MCHRPYPETQKTSISLGKYIDNHTKVIESLAIIDKHTKRQVLQGSLT